MINRIDNPATEKVESYLDAVNKENAVESKQRTEEDKVKFKQLQEQMESVKAVQSGLRLESAQDFNDSADEYFQATGLGNLIDLKG